MKNLRINLLLLVALLVTAATVSAFTMFNREAPAKPRLTYTWVFTGNSSEIQTSTKWEKTEILPEDCDEVGDSPCSISVEAENDGQLSTFLNSKTVPEIMALSSARRP